MCRYRARLYSEKEKEYNELSQKITKGREKNKLIDRLLQFEAQKEKLGYLKAEINNKTVILELSRKGEKVLFAEKNYNSRKNENMPGHLQRRKNLY